MAFDCAMDDSALHVWACMCSDWAIDFLMIFMRHIITKKNVLMSSLLRVVAVALQVKGCG